VVCFFARGVHTLEVVRDALALSGFGLSDDDLARLGQETLRRKQASKVREGFDLAQLRIPRRILETPSPLGAIDEAFLREVLRIVADKERIAL
jgi:aldehyde:ferredoxin oxidoreductase